MPKSKKMKSRKRTAFPRLGRAASKELMSLLMLGKALIDLKGLNILKVRRGFKFVSGRASAGTNSMIPMHTTKKSSQFHGSRRYEFLWTQKPMATILMIDSRVKVAVKTRPAFSMNLFL